MDCVASAASHLILIVFLFWHQLRELNTGDDPRGLVLLFSALQVWNYDRDPRETLAYEDAFQELKDEVERTSGDVFVSMIREHLLYNTHRVVTELYPSSTVEQEYNDVSIVCAGFVAIRSGVF